MVKGHHTNNCIWVGNNGKGRWRVPSGKGQRLIVVHAGGVKGWVDSRDLIFFKLHAKIFFIVHHCK